MGFVLPHLTSGQLVEHCKRPFLQRIQPTLSLRFLRDSQAHSRVILWKGSRLSSTAVGFE